MKTGILHQSASRGVPWVELRGNAARAVPDEQIIRGHVRFAGIPIGDGRIRDDGGLAT